MSDTQLAAARFIDGQLLERRENGTALVEIPILTTAEFLDLSKTEGGGKGKIPVTEAMLQEFAENFEKWPKPVGFGFDGLEGHQDDRGGPQSVFAESLRAEGGVLYAVADLNPFATMLVIGNGSGDPRERSFRAFSIEGRRNASAPTIKTIRGWVLTGGLFTNNPAVDTRYKIAASAEVESEETGTSFTPFTFSAPAAADKGDSEMAAETKAAEAAESKETTIITTPPVSKAESVSLVYHEQELGKVRAELTANDGTINSMRAQLAAQDTRIKELEAGELSGTTDRIELEGDRATLNARVNSLKLENTVLTTARDQLTQKCNEQADALKRIRDEADDTEAEKVIAAAVEAGNAPALFENWKEDFTDVNALKRFTSALTGTPTIPTGSAAKSGHDPKDSSDDGEPRVSDETRAKLKAMKIDTSVDFTGVTTEEEAHERIEASKQE